MKLKVVTQRLNGHRHGDIIVVDDNSVAEYLINSGQCEKLEETAAKAVTTVKEKATKVLRKKRKD